MTRKINKVEHYLITSNYSTVIHCNQSLATINYSNHCAHISVTDNVSSHIRFTWKFQEAYNRCYFQTPQTKRRPNELHQQTGDDQNPSIIVIAPSSRSPINSGKDRQVKQTTPFPSMHPAAYGHAKCVLH